MSFRLPASSCQLANASHQLPATSVHVRNPTIEEHQQGSAM